jgi:hypothetical protein
MGERQTTLTERITFAEDWVGRARRQIQGGDLAHGTLTLLLAQAELQRAREVGSRDTAPGRGIGQWAVTALAVIIAASAVSMVVTPGREPLSAQAEVPVIVRLPDRYGALLQMVAVPEPAVERAPVQPAPVRAAAPALRPARPTAAAPQAEQRPHPPAPAFLASAPSAPPVQVAAMSPIVPAVEPAVTLLSAADVIDLVLAAERSLRRPADR